MATITNLNARLMLTDVNFGTGLVRAEQNATKFTKQVTKIGNSVGSISRIAAEAESLNATIGGANTTITAVTGSLGTMSMVLSSGTTLVFGLRQAFLALSGTLAANPIGIAALAISAAVGAFLAITSKMNEGVKSFKERAEEAAKAATELDSKIADRSQKMNATAAATERRQAVEDARAKGASESRLYYLDQQIERLQRLEKASEAAAKRQAELASAWEMVEERSRAAKETEEQTSRRKFAEGIKGQSETARFGLMSEFDEGTRLQAEKALRQELADIERAAGEASLTETEKRIRAIQAMADKAAKTNLDGSKSGIAIDENKLRKQLDAADAAAKAKELEAQLAEFERSANEAWLSDTDKKLKMLEDLARKTGRIVDLEKVRRQIEASERPRELEKQISGAQKMIQDLEKRQQSIEGMSGSGEASSPKALLKGSVEADLAASRASNPVERLTEIQKKQLAEIQRQRTIAEQQLRAFEQEKENNMIAQF